MIFLTIGSRLPFDRLVQLVDDVVSEEKIRDEVFAQIGDGYYAPKNFEYERFMSKKEYDKYFHEATAIISHAGIGTISLALQLDKPILVMPRKKIMHEIVDNHQVVSARKWSDLGHVLAFDNKDELESRLNMLCKFRPRRRQPNIDGISAAIADYLTNLVSSKQNRQNLS